MPPQYPPQNDPFSQPGPQAVPPNGGPVYQPSGAGPGAGGSYPGKTLGIVGLVLDFIVPLVGLILSVVALRQSKKAGYKNTPALIGVILGVVSVIIGIVFVAIVLISFGSVQNRAYDVERKTDVETITAQAEAYYVAKGSYPASLTELQQSSSGIDPAVFSDPQGDSYNYQATPAGCSANCTAFTVSAKLQDGTTYSRNSLAP